MKKLKSIEPFSAAGLLAELYTAFSILYLVQVLITGAPTMYAPVGFALPYLYLKLDFTSRGAPFFCSRLWPMRFQDGCPAHSSDSSTTYSPVGAGG